MNYQGKLKEFFDYLGLPGDDVEQQGQAFLDKARLKKKEEEDDNDDNDDYYAHQTSWVQGEIMSFLAKQRERVYNKELRAGSLGNYYRPIKKFCDAYDDVADKIRWNRRGKSLQVLRPLIACPVCKETTDINAWPRSDILKHVVVF